MGPLAGIKIIEIKGIGPGPFAGMLLADLGAEVIVVERSNKPNGIAVPSKIDPASRGKKSIALNLKEPAGVEALLKLIEQSDGLIEGYRPGVTERLGFGPDVCLERNPKLVYGRITGWGKLGRFQVRLATILTTYQLPVRSRQLVLVKNLCHRST